jgi:putative ABC transport system permease protein
LTGAADSAGSWRLAATLARRELRGGLKGFRIFLACLLLGVAVIAAVGSTGAAVRNSILADAQKILGGDVELRVLYKPLTAEQLAFICRATASYTRCAPWQSLSAGRQCQEMKAIDGSIRSMARWNDPPISLAAATEQVDGRQCGGGRESDRAAEPEDR